MTRMRLASAIRTRSALSLLSLALLLLLIFALQPRAMTYRGLGLLLGFSAPVVLATLAQMFVMTVGDLDLSIGPFIGLVACIVATLPAISPLLTVAALVAGVLAYMAVGALISWRRLPALVVTLGLSFVWFGIAIIVRPNPGGEAPEWVENFINLQTPVAPIQLWIVCVVGLAGYFILQHSKQGLLLRAAGGGAVALQRERGSWPMASQACLASLPGSHWSALRHPPILTSPPVTPWSQSPLLCLEAVSFPGAACRCPDRSPGPM
jgi:ribose transport system permease protein